MVFHKNSQAQSASNKVIPQNIFMSMFSSYACDIDRHQGTKALGNQLHQKLKGISEDKEEREEKEVEKEEEEEEVKELKQLSDQLLDGAALNSADKYATLFKDCYFFLAREVPRESLEFVIRSFGGNVSWPGSLTGEPESSPRITHHIMDRPSQKHIFLGREYIQPQWVYDSANYCTLLLTHEVTY